MRIAESSLELQSRRAAVSFARETTSVSVRREAAAPPPPAPEPEDRVELCAPDEELRDGDLRAWLTRLVLRAFGVDGRPAEDDEEPGMRAGRRRGGDGPPARPPVTSVELRTERVAYEAESVHVGAVGSVTTTDGRRIDVAVTLDMSREHYERTTARLRIGPEPVRKDPLVMNLAGGAASLTGPRIDLDLDGDGARESIATPGGGSAFLALDRDGDGRVGDGTELFGARTGDGFAELAALDEDADGWIDEDDGGWALLRVWDTARGSLLGLREAGVGAIHTGSVRSDFALGRTAADAAGFVAATGVFLRSDGGAGTVQHVDLVV